MSDFNVFPSLLNEQAEEMDDLVSELVSCMYKLDSVCSMLDTSDSAMSQVKASLAALSKDLNTYVSSAGKMASVLSSSASFYTKAEKKIMGKSIWDKHVAEVYAYKQEANGSTIYMGAATAAAGLSHKEGNYTDKSKFYEKKQEQRTKKSKNEEVKYPKKNSTIAQVKAEASADATLLGGSYEGKYGSVKAKIGTAEAHASVTAGLYGYTKDGKQVFAPEVNAVVGASVCAATLAGTASVGGDYFGAKASGDASALKASAKADASAAMFRSDGKFDPTLKASASAEAVAVEANGSVGVKVLGVEGKVTGGVKVGVGAHADIGYTNGVVKCNVGASLGVGVNLGFEIDVGSAVKGVVSGAKSVWNTVTGWF